MYCTLYCTVLYWHMQVAKTRADVDSALPKLPWTDREFVLDVVAEDGKELRHTPEGAPLRADRKVVATAAAQDILALSYAAHELKADR
eukprot:COSAG05_NODE_333_length_11249_cov_629.633094_9_plen_88_part_00